MRETRRIICLKTARRVGAFTIVELLVATAILSLLLVVILSSVSNVSGIWRRASDKVKSFQDARLAFETITRSLSQATLNTYLDYDDANNPRQYLRKSDLKFISDSAGSGGMPGTQGAGQAVFFQAPIGYSARSDFQAVSSLLNTCGFYVDYGPNASLPPHVSSGANSSRYRLMQLLVPTEQNDVFVSSGKGWFSTYTSQARAIADNVVALIIRPQDPALTNSGQSGSAPNDEYAYDSTASAQSNPQPITANQLPPVVQVTMVAIDETSAVRLGGDVSAKIGPMLSGKFSDPALYESDLDSLTQALSSQGINYRVFTSAVPIRESKWTK
jgi:uncharacterized protein (TIGR02599 family)